jgi:hypothetical protein
LSIFVCKDTSKCEAYHLTNASAVSETCLPGCGDLVTSIRSELAILFGERREGKEAEDNLVYVSFILEKRDALD